VANSRKMVMSTKRIVDGTPMISGCGLIVKGGFVLCGVSRVD